MDDLSMKFSIIICNYNYASYLNEAIQSAVNQTYLNKEIIVVDDGSTDQSRAILENWKNKLTVIFKDNAGQISSYNVGFNVAKGDIVIFLDSDDILDLDACEKIIGSFQDDDVVKVHYKLRLIDRESKILGPSIPSFLSEGNLRSPLVNKGWFYLSSPGSGNAYRKAILNKLFPLPVSNEDKHGADFYCIYGVALYGSIKTINQNLASYRVHSEAKEEENIDSFVFGNAAKKLDELDRLKRRFVIFKSWIFAKTNGNVDLKKFQFDFSMLKQEYCISIFNHKNYFSSLLVGLKLLPNLVKSILSRIQFPLHNKAVLIIWGLLVLFLPRKIGRSLAAKVSNPAAR